MLVCDNKVMKQERLGKRHKDKCGSKRFYETYEYNLNCTANPNSEVLVCASCGMGYSYENDRNTWKSVVMNG